MKCPNCKNPVDDNAVVCEWCGESLHNQLTDLETELIDLLEDGESGDDLDSAIFEAEEEYQISTGVSDEDAKNYIDRLNFFRQYKYATEEAYQKYQKKLERDEKESEKEGWLGCFLRLGLYIFLFVFCIFILLLFFTK